MYDPDLWILPLPKVKKHFGQHFLHDSRVITEIINQIHPLPGEHIIEIGPGTGALTFPLAAKATQFTALEIDRSLIDNNLLPKLKKLSQRYTQAL